MALKVCETFSSLMGESTLAGAPAFFIRLTGCNLRCRYCDTAYAYEGGEEMSVAQLVAAALAQPARLALVTGGEPLLQVDFLKEVMQLCRQHGKKTYLETNGTLYNELKTVLDEIDIIAMDFKLPSSTGLHSLWDEHKRFLEVASNKKIFVKMVICHSTKEEDLNRALGLIKAMGKDITIVLQPNFFETDRGLLKKISDFQKIALDRLTDVRIIPQIHKYIGKR